MLAKALAISKRARDATKMCDVTLFFTYVSSMDIN